MCCVGLAVSLTGCLDPLVDDEVPPGAHVLPAGTVVPDLEDDPVMAAQVTANDGVGDLVPRLSAFADGERVWYWTFGEAVDQAIPIYRLVTAGSDGSVTPVADHPTIIDSIPGDNGYSPFWAVFDVAVTSDYDGERLTSFQAVQDAEQLGLVEAPALVPMIVNCPVVHRDTRLQTRGDAAGDASGEPNRFYYRGVWASYFDMGVATGTVDLTYPVGAVYVLNREGGLPLSEPMRGVDMTGDGDTVDSNNVFEMGRLANDYTPLWRVVLVSVAASTGSIDTSADETSADIMSSAQLFTYGAQTGAPKDPVLAVQSTDTLINCPIECPADAEGCSP